MVDGETVRTHAFAFDRSLEFGNFGIRSARQRRDGSAGREKNGPENSDATCGQHDNFSFSYSRARSPAGMTVGDSALKTANDESRDAGTRVVVCTGLVATL